MTKTCESVADPRLERYAAGCSEEAEQAQIADHIAGCEPCRARLQALADESSLVRERLTFALDGALAPRRRRARWAWALVAAAVIAVIALAGPPIQREIPVVVAGDVQPNSVPVVAPLSRDWEPAPDGWRRAPGLISEIRVPGRAPAASPPIADSVPSLIEHLARAELVIAARIEAVGNVDRGPEGAAVASGPVTLTGTEILRGTTTLPTPPPCGEAERQRARELVPQLEDPRYRVRESAHGALLALGPGIADVLIPLRQHAELEVRLRAADLERHFQNWSTEQLLGFAQFDLVSGSWLSTSTGQCGTSSEPSIGWHGALIWQRERRTLVLLWSDLPAVRRALRMLEDPWVGVRSDDDAERADALQGLSWQADRTRAALAFADSVATSGVPRGLLPFGGRAVLERALARLASGLDDAGRAAVTRRLEGVAGPDAVAVRGALGSR